MLSKALSKVGQLPKVSLISQSDNKLNQCLLGRRRALSVGTQIFPKGNLDKQEVEITQMFNF